MYTIKFERSFLSDYRRITRAHPFIKREFEVAMRELAERGELPEMYGAHVLDNPGGNYNGCIDFHLSEGKVDIVVRYLPHRTNPIIRFVRMGSHADLCQGPVV